jgi:very-short-patch-repair endonuclease
VVDAIPVTSVARTLLDLAAVAPRQIDQALEKAERLGKFDLVAIHSLLGRCGRHRGAPKLRRALGLYVPVPQTRSELERRFLALLEDAGLARPAVNASVAGHEVDMLWPRRRLVVELDGYEYHRTRAAFERDRRRDEDLKVAGYEVTRLTARRLAEEPAIAVGRVGTLLGRQAGSDE